jgi:hypothetical protein
MALPDILRNNDVERLADCLRFAEPEDPLSAGIQNRMTPSPSA